MAKWVHSIDDLRLVPVALTRLLALGAAALCLVGCQSGPLCELPGTAVPSRSIYLVAGQSNAAGLASVRDLTDRSADLTDVDLHYPAVQIWGILGAPYGAAGHDLAELSRFVDWHTLAGWHAAQPGFGYKSFPNTHEHFSPDTRAEELFGPELSLARHLAELPFPTPYIVKLAVANTPLGPKSGSDSWQVDGHLYRQFLQMIADAHNSKKEEMDLKVAGLFFMQGETDAMHQSLAVQYESNLQAFIMRLRADLVHMKCAEKEEFPVVLGRIQDNPAWTWRMQVRAAQEKISRQLPAVFWVDTDDFAEELVADGVHFNAYAQMLLGDRVFRTFLHIQKTEAASPSEIGRLMASSGDRVSANP